MVNVAINVTQDNTTLLHTRENQCKWCKASNTLVLMSHRQISGMYVYYQSRLQKGWDSYYMFEEYATIVIVKDEK